MAGYRKRTLRRMSPTARKVARLAGEALSVGRRLQNLVPEVQRLDLDSQALANAKAQHPIPTPDRMKQPQQQENE